MYRLASCGMAPRFSRMDGMVMTRQENQSTILRMRSSEDRLASVEAPKMRRLRWCTCMSLIIMNSSRNCSSVRALMFLK